ncbi:MAG TPA: histidine phosphatase family protein [Methylovirgula sp.]|nr:histidine phosphatase family protein [Methylovirgula sp.]
MLRLAILRHAEAVPLAGGGDADRELSQSGRALAERMGRYFRDAGFKPDLALVSPSKRTRETFEAVERGAGETFAVDYVPALYSASLATLEDVLAGAPKEAQFLLVVGHNPGLAEFANALAGKGKKSELARMRGHFPPPCLAVIDFDAKSWKKAGRGEGRLEYFVTRGALAK